MRHLNTRFKEKHCPLFKKRDIYLYLFLLVILITVVYLSFASSKGSLLLVRINGVTQYRFSLDEEGIKSIESNGKKLMDLLINESDVRIINSQCPLHLCERGTLNLTGVLVCVPQKVIITLDNEEAPVNRTDGIDLITG